MPATFTPAEAARRAGTPPGPFAPIGTTAEDYASLIREGGPRLKSAIDWVTSIPNPRLTPAMLSGIRDAGNPFTTPQMNQLGLRGDPWALEATLARLIGNAPPGGTATVPPPASVTPGGMGLPYTPATQYSTPATTLDQVFARSTLPPPSPGIQAMAPGTSGGQNPPPGTTNGTPGVPGAVPSTVPPFYQQFVPPTGPGANQPGGPVIPPFSGTSSSGGGTGGSSGSGAADAAASPGAQIAAALGILGGAAGVKWLMDPANRTLAMTFLKDKLGMAPGTPGTNPTELNTNSAYSNNPNAQVTGGEITTPPTTGDITSGAPSSPTPDTPTVPTAGETELQLSPETIAAFGGDQAQAEHAIRMLQELDLNADLGGGETLDGMFRDMSPGDAEAFINLVAEDSGITPGQAASGLMEFLGASDIVAGAAGGAGVLTGLYGVAQGLMSDQDAGIGQVATSAVSTASSAGTVLYTLGGGVGGLVGYGAAVSASAAAISGYSAGVAAGTVAAVEGGALGAGIAAGGGGMAGLGATIGAIAAPFAPIAAVGAIGIMNDMHQQAKRIENQTKESVRMRQDFANAVPKLEGAAEAANVVGSIAGMAPQDQITALTDARAKLEDGIAQISPIFQGLDTGFQGGKYSTLKGISDDERRQLDSGLRPKLYDTLIGYVRTVDALAQRGVDTPFVAGRNTDPVAIANQLSQLAGVTVDPYKDPGNLVNIAPGNLERGLMDYFLERGGPGVRNSPLFQRGAQAPSTKAVDADSPRLAAQIAANTSGRRTSVLGANAADKAAGGVGASAYSAPYAGITNFQDLLDAYNNRGGFNTPSGTGGP